MYQRVAALSLYDNVRKWKLCDARKWKMHFVGSSSVWVFSLQDFGCFDSFLSSFLSRSRLLRPSHFLFKVLSVLCSFCCRALSLCLLTFLSLFPPPVCPLFRLFPLCRSLFFLSLCLCSPVSRYIAARCFSGGVFRLMSCAVLFKTFSLLLL